MERKIEAELIAWKKIYWKDAFGVARGKAGGENICG